MKQSTMAILAVVAAIVGVLFWRSYSDDRLRLSAAVEQEEAAAVALRAELARVHSDVDGRILDLKSQVTNLVSSCKEKDRSIEELRKKLLATQAVSRKPAGATRPGVSVPASPAGGRP